MNGPAAVYRATGDQTDQESRSVPRLTLVILVTRHKPAARVIGGRYRASRSSPARPSRRALDPRLQE